MTFEIAKLTATELAAHHRAKTLSPVDAARAALDQIERHNGAVNAFCLVDGDRALADAKSSEQRFARGEPLGPLDGVTATIKDLLLSEGWPTLRGSLTIDPNQTWDEDAPCVARLREQGVVFLGKTTTPEFGWKGVTDSKLSGITRNPWDLSRTPGGSSGGAAVAAALAWARCTLEPMAADRSAFRPASRASWASSRLSGACRPTPLAHLATWRTSVRSREA